MTDIRVLLLGIAVGVSIGIIMKMVLVFLLCFFALTLVGFLFGICFFALTLLNLLLGTRLQIEEIIDPVSIKERLPGLDDLEPKTCYRWWFNIDNDTWLYGDASALGDPWRHWLPCWAKPLLPGPWLKL